MKSFFIILSFLGFAVNVHSQETMTSNYPSSVPHAEELPEVVIKNAGKDFSVYLPDKNGDASIRQLEERFISYNLGKDFEGFINYLVIMESEKGTLTATYNEHGKLIQVVENYKNIKIPSAVLYTLYKNYPGWEIIKDNFTYSQSDGKVNKKNSNCENQG